MDTESQPAQTDEDISSPVPAELERRKFLVQIVGGIAGGIALAGLFTGTKSVLSSTTAGGLSEDLNETLRMHTELQRALAKKPEERRWGMVIDARRCIGCQACTVACIAENNLPPGVTYRTVPETEFGEYPSPRRYFMPTNCMQCDNPPCIEAANRVIPESMAKRPDGIVEIDYTKMKGREVYEAAQRACPYTALYYDEGRYFTDDTPALQPYERRTVSEYDKSWTREQTANATRKCTFCAQRLAAGLLPACVTTCTGQAMHFGDLNDPHSLVAELVKDNRALQLESGKGTQPRVYYLADQPEETCMSCHSF